MFVTTAWENDMPKRMISSDMWSDKVFEELGHKEKLLFVYLITSPYTSQAGIGQVTDKRIADDIGLQRKEISEIMQNISMLVERQDEWFWVKNFLSHQGQNPSFCTSAIKYAEKTPFFEKVKEIAESMIANFELRASKRTKYNITEQKVVTPSNDSDTTVGIKNIITNHGEPTVAIESDINTRPYDGKTASANTILQWSQALGICQFSEFEKMAILDLAEKGCIADDAFAARLNSPKYFGKIDNEHTRRLIVTQKDIREKAAKKSQERGWAF